MKEIVLHVYQPQIQSEGRLSVSGKITFDLNVELNQWEIMDMKDFFSELIDVPVNFILTQEEHEAALKKENIYFCSVCHKNTVDVSNGIDTCESCVSNV